MQFTNASAPLSARLRAGAMVLLLHVAAIAGLLRIFTPDYAAQIVQMALISVNLAEPKATIKAQTVPAGAQGASGKKALAKPIAAPKIAIAPVTQSAPPIAATGAEDRAGANASGTANAAGALGAGGGNGAGGNGQGSGTKLQQIAGTIDSARDYPIASRDLRIGKAVLIVFTVGVDGRAHDCEIREASGDPDADAITCRLAIARFRFKPATDAMGNAIAAPYGWRQKWHY